MDEVAIDELRLYFDTNLKRYIEKHSEEYVLLEKSEGGISETFFKRKETIDNLMKKEDFEGKVYLLELIPHPRVHGLISKLSHGDDEEHVCV